MKRVLLLNSDWSPLNFVSDRRAFNLIRSGRASVITVGESPSLWGDYFSTVSRRFEVPATICLVDKVRRKLTSPRFRKSVLFNRDDWQCQYCFTKLDRTSVTIDHVFPRSLGGRTSWRNCVTSCKKCNTRKGSKTLDAVGMRLVTPPSEPKVFHYWDRKVDASWHPDWSYFLASHDTYRP